MSISIVDIHAQESWSILTDNKDVLYSIRRGYSNGPLLRMVHPEPQSFLPLSTATLHILLALAGGDRHGYAIMKEVDETTEGTIRLGPGTLYRSIESLREDGLIEESAHRPAKDEDQRRRYYRLTGVGRRVLAAESRRLAAIVALAHAKKVLQKAPA